MISFRRTEIFCSEFYFPDRSSSKFLKIRLVTKKCTSKGMHFLGARARSEPFSPSRTPGKSLFAKLAQLNGNNSILGPKIGKLAKFLTLGAKNDIFAPMAPTLINVMVSLVFWDRFYLFPDFERNFTILRKNNL